MGNRAKCSTRVVVLLCVGLLTVGFWFVTTAYATDLRPIALTSTHDHAKYAPTAIGSDIVRKFRAYTTCFDGDDDDDGDGVSDKWCIPHWVAYEMKQAASVPGPFEDRPKPWIHDDALFAQKTCPNDETYKNSGFSRGHLCMRLHARRLGKDADFNTFTVLNAVPQLQAMNAGVWQHLENKTAAWADHFGAVFVICGPVVFNRKPTRFIGDGNEVKAVVPDACYKIVVRETSTVPEGVVVLAFIIPQEGVPMDPNAENKFSSSSKSPLIPYLTSVDIVETLTGLNFLVSLTDATQAVVEKTVAVELWPTE